MFGKTRIIIVNLIIAISIANPSIAEKTSKSIAVKITAPGKAGSQAAVHGAGLYINADPASWSYGLVATNSTVLSDLVGPRCSVQNTSAIPLSFTVRATLSGGMTMGNSLGDAGPDRCVLAAIFTHWDSTLTPGEFNDPDVIGSTTVAATNTNYADDAETDPDLLGFNVGPGETRDMRFLLQTPTLDTTWGKVQTIYLTLSSLEYPADSAICQLSFQIPSPVPFTIISPSLDFGGVGLNSNELSNQAGFMPRCIVRNESDRTLTYVVRATLSGGMTMGNGLGDAGPDRCVLAAIFTHWDSTLTPGEFNDPDVIGSTPVAATNTNYADDAETDSDLLGFNVGPDEIRDMRFLLQTPTLDTTGGAEQTIIITFTCVELGGSASTELSFHVNPESTPTATSTLTPSATITETATMSPTATATPTLTSSATVTETATLSPTATATPTLTSSATITETATMSPTATATPTLTSSATITETATMSPTATATPTLTSSATITETATMSPTATATPTLTSSATITETAAISPTTTATFTLTPSATVTETATPYPTATNITTPTPSAAISSTVTITPTSIFGLESGGPIAYPNPGRDKVTFLFAETSNEKARIEIYNMCGERIAGLKQDRANEPLIWDCKNIPPGIYMYRAHIKINGQDKDLGSKKIAIVR